MVKKKGTGNFWRTKIIKLYNAVFLVNKTESDLYWRQSQSEQHFVIKPETQVPIHWTNNKISLDDRKIQLSYDQSTWSLEFGIKELCTLEIFIFSNKNNKVISHDIKMTTDRISTSVVISRRDIFNSPKYLIINGTVNELIIKQYKTKSNHQIVLPQSRMPYYWENPLMEQRFLEVILIGNIRHYTLDEEMSHEPVRVDRNIPIFPKTYFQGDTRILHFAQVKDDDSGFDFVTASKKQSISENTIVEDFNVSYDINIPSVCLSFTSNVPKVYFEFFIIYCLILSFLFLKGIDEYFFYKCGCQF